MNSGNSNKGGAKEFLKGFLVTLIFVIPLFAATILFSSVNPTIINENSSEQVSEVVENLPIASAKSFNLLFLVYDTNLNTNLLASTLVRFDTENYRTSVCVLPVETVVLDSKSPQTLLSVFASRGASGVKSAISETLEIPISGYLCGDTNALKRIVDKLGEFDYALSDDILVYDSSGIITYSKHKGLSSFGGNDVVKLLYFSPKTQTEKTAMLEEVWNAALKQYANSKFSDKLSGILRSELNNLATDLNTTAVYSLTKAVDSVCSENSTDFCAIRLDGSYIDNRFELAEDSDKRLWLYFPNIS